MKRGQLFGLAFTILLHSFAQNLKRARGSQKRRRKTGPPHECSGNFNRNVILGFFDNSVWLYGHDVCTVTKCESLSIHASAMLSPLDSMSRSTLSPAVPGRNLFRIHWGRVDLHEDALQCFGIRYLNFGFCSGT